LENHETNHLEKNRLPHFTASRPLASAPTGVAPRGERALAKGVRVPILTVSDLIQNKLAAGRPKDLADVELLKKQLKH